MAPQARAPTPEDADLQDYIAEKLGEEGLSSDENGEPGFSARAGRLGLVYAAVFYGGLLAVVGLGLWGA
jgi:hypothetical protein